MPLQPGMRTWEERKERQKWIKEHAEEILDYRKTHSRTATARHFRVGGTTLAKLEQKVATIPKRPPVETGLETKLREVPIEEMGDLLLSAFLNRLEGLEAELTAQKKKAEDEIAELRAQLESQRQLKETIANLREQLKKTQEERDRVIRIHNEEIARRAQRKERDFERIKKALE